MTQLETYQDSLLDVNSFGQREIERRKSVRPWIVTDPGSQSRAKSHLVGDLCEKNQLLLVFFSKKEQVP